MSSPAALQSHRADQFLCSTLWLLLSGKYGESATPNILPWKRVLIGIRSVTAEETRQRILNFVSQTRLAGRMSIRSYMLFMGKFSYYNFCLFTAALYGKNVWRLTSHCAVKDNMYNFSGDKSEDTCTMARSGPRDALSAKYV